MRLISIGSAHPALRIVSILGILTTALLLAACGGGGGGGLAAGPVVLADGGQPLGGSPGQLGTPTPGTVADSSYYETAEYLASGSPAPLATGKFSKAYARGWTGRGSLIAIADTGVDSDHPDLEANISSMRDFTGTVDEDRHGHGTHVAGIVAAAKDGAGVHGGAFHASLAIAKVADTQAYDFGLARQATAWARDHDAVATNVSAAYLRDGYLESRLVQIGPGDYYLDHPTYGLNGFYGFKQTAVDWRAALGPQQVLVKAAGNNNTSYSAAVNQLATATDSTGKLILNGQMLIVGNWDTANQQIKGNQAGNVCTSWNGTCLDAAKISDSFILAPGTNIRSTYLGGSYATMTGTSMAAPLVSSAVAILHQMWPHLDGRQLASLILATADKDLPGCAEHTHGQGLLDLDRATQPLGDITLPVSSEVTGDSIELSGGGAMGPIDHAALAALSQIMVLDDYDRDFYIDLAREITPVDTRRGSVASAGGLTDGYAGYFEARNHLSIQAALSSSLSLIGGFGAEASTFLGNSLSGALGEIHASQTAYGLINLQRPLGGSGANLFGQLGGGVTMLDHSPAPSLLVETAPVLLQTATLGATYPFANGMVAQASASQRSLQVR